MFLRVTNYPKRLHTKPVADKNQLPRIKFPYLVLPYFVDKTVPGSFYCPYLFIKISIMTVVWHLLRVWLFAWFIGLKFSMYNFYRLFQSHYNDVMISMMAFQISSLTIVYWTVYSGADQRKHRWSVNSPHKWPVTRIMLPFDDVIMWFWRYVSGRTWLPI